ncbi:MAG: ankyrin repeat domain-containing protein [Rickettsiales endosymbiont of Dermacentor nuttalli]
MDKKIFLRELKRNALFVQDLENVWFHSSLLKVKDAEGKTALFHAINNNNFGIMKYLLKKKANIKHRNKDSETPIFTTARCGDL